MYACVSVMACHVGVCACIGAYMNQCCFFFFSCRFCKPNQTNRKCICVRGCVVVCNVSDDDGDGDGI